MGRCCPALGQEQLLQRLGSTCGASESVPCGAVADSSCRSKFSVWLLGFWHLTTSLPDGIWWSTAIAKAGCALTGLLSCIAVGGVGAAAGAQHTIEKGRARPFDHKALIHAIWLHVLKRNIGIFVQRVPSKENFSNDPTRENMISLKGYRGFDLFCQSFCRRLASPRHGNRCLCSNGGQVPSAHGPVELRTRLLPHLCEGAVPPPCCLQFRVGSSLL